MAEKRPLIVLRLEGVLQSWGEESKWDLRDSANMPTKSGVIGLIACAMGLERDDPNILSLNQAVQLAVRADRPGTRAIDFQTITGNPLRTAEGKRRSSGNTFISKRNYLQDASFLVVLEVELDWHDRIVTALRRPKWCIYLGRKNCVPSRPVLEQANAAYNNLIDAISNYPLAQRARYPVTYESEQPDPNSASYTRPDQKAGMERGFVRRRVWRGIVKEVSNVSNQN